MEWKKLKEQYIEIIHEQLRESRATVNAYKYLMSQGYDGTQAIEALCMYLHMLTMEVLQSEQEYREENWALMLQSVYHERSGIVVNKETQDSLLLDIEKEIGIINSGEEEEYLEALMSYEGQILRFALYHGLTSKEIECIVRAWIVKMYGSYIGKSYNQLNCLSADLDEMAQTLNCDGNPYLNEGLRKSIEEQDDTIDFNQKEVRDEIFQTGIRCLQRVLISIRFWNRERGQEGYLSYLKDIFMEEGE